MFVPPHRCSNPPRRATQKSTPFSTIHVSSAIILKSTKPRKKRVELQCTETDMARAIEAHEQEMSMRECSRQYGMSVTALAAWMDERTKKKKKGPAPTIPIEEEEALVQWAFRMQDAGQGVSLKLKAAELCQARQTPFTNGVPGKSWWDCFRRRHPTLTFRMSESLDRSKAINLRLEVVKLFHDNVQSMWNQHEYPAENIWNADEIGVMAGRDKGMRVLARKGSKVVYGIAPDSREWLTILCCVNAVGGVLPGYYIFKGKKAKQNYLLECENGAVMSMQGKAWMIGQLFEAWLEHFKSSVPTPLSPTERHLLIVDGHGSHTRVQLVQKAMEWGIDIITLPAHTSHKLQPLDVSVFKPFKSNFQKERNLWQVRSYSIQATKSELAGVASRALALICTETNIKAGFHAAGIWPINHCY